MAGAANVSVEIEGLPQLKRALKELGDTSAPFFAEAMDEIGQDLRDNVASRAPGSMGGRTQLTGVKGRGATQRAVVTVKHPGAKVREFGRGPLTIRPRGKKALAWGGARHPVRIVKQRGRDARPFIGIVSGGLAVGATMAEAPDILRRAIEAEWARLAPG